MDSQRLTDADFLDAAPAPVTEPSPTTEADYPGRAALGAPVAESESLTPAEAPSPVAVAVEAQDATPSPDADLSATDPDAAEPETQQAAPSDADRRYAELEARLEQERQRAEALETKERQREAADAEARIQTEWAQFDSNQRREKLAVLEQSRKMSDVDATRYLDYHTNRLQAERDNKWAEVTHQREAQQQKLITFFARDKFVDAVITKNELPPEAAAELRRYDPNVMEDWQLEAFIDRWAEIKTLRHQATQTQREHAAQARIADGADAMGGLRGGSAAPPPSYLDPKSEDYDPVAAYHGNHGIGQWSRTRF